MMSNLNVFIASSTEGLGIAKSFRNMLQRELLQRELEGHAKVNLWTGMFDLGATYIESIEEISQSADFAVLVLTEDDITISRKEEKAAPRDNVVFELGLFMGSLGRKRCFVIHQTKIDLKLPTDLLGVETAKYNASGVSSLEDALYDPSVRIGQQIEKVGVKASIDLELLAARRKIERFGRRTEGGWWQRIRAGGSGAISFARIEHDVLYNSVKLIGRTYNNKGARVANWNSIFSYPDTSANRILYMWAGGWADRAHLPFSGFGEFTFDKPTTPDAEFRRGFGKFWEVDEANPELTMVRPVELRRVSDIDCIRTMTEGTQSEINEQVLAALDEW
jgi:hypothetical protein